MRVIKTMTSPLTVWTLLCIVAVSASGVWGQEAGGGGGDDGKPRSALSIEAANWSSVDRWMFDIQGECWATDANRDDGTLGAAGSTTFMVRQGSQEVLQVTPLDAIDADDGTVSGRYTVCSDEVMLIDGSLEPCDDPILVEAGNIPERSFDVVVPHVTGIQLKRGSSWEDTPVDALQTVCKDATLTFRALVEPAGSCSVIWGVEGGGDIGSGQEITLSFTGAATITARCDGASESGQQSASISIVENPSFPGEQASVRNIGECSTDLGRCTYGGICKEDLDISVSACLDNGRWQPIVTDVLGSYGRTVGFPPEVQDVAGATTPENFCHQVEDLQELNHSCPPEGDMGHWYSLEAVNAHEDVHEQAEQPMLALAVETFCEAATEGWLIADEAGKSLSQAIEEITQDVLPRAEGDCQGRWFKYSQELGECPSMEAEVTEINRILDGICPPGCSVSTPDACENCLACLTRRQVPSECR